MTRYGAATLAFALLWAVVAFADEPAGITLTLTPSEVSYVWGVLAKQPYQEVAVMMAKMQEQVKAQEKTNGQK